MHALENMFSIHVGNIVVFYMFYDLPSRDLDYRIPSVVQLEKMAVAKRCG